MLWFIIFKFVEDEKMLDLVVLKLMMSIDIYLFYFLLFFKFMIEREFLFSDVKILKCIFCCYFWYLRE